MAETKEEWTTKGKTFWASGTEDFAANLLIMKVLRFSVQDLGWRKNGKWWFGEKHLEQGSEKQRRRATNRPKHNDSTSF